LKNPNPILGKLYNQTREVLVGTVADDTFYPGGGWDVVDGGLGTDTVIYSGPSEQYTVNKSGNRYIVREPTGSVADGAKLMGALLGPAFVKDKALANELNQYVGMLQNGSATQASLAVLAANTDLNAARIDLVGLIQHGWEFV
jgi:hypothetical protein